MPVKGGGGGLSAEVLPGATKFFEKVVAFNTNLLTWTEVPTFQSTIGYNGLFRFGIRLRLSSTQAGYFYAHVKIRNDTKGIDYADQTTDQGSFSLKTWDVPCSKNDIIKVYARTDWDVTPVYIENLGIYSSTPAILT